MDDEPYAIVLFASGDFSYGFGLYRRRKKIYNEERVMIYERNKTD